MVKPPILRVKPAVFQPWNTSDPRPVTSDNLSGVMDSTKRTEFCTHWHCTVHIDNTTFYSTTATTFTTLGMYRHIQIHMYIYICTIHIWSLYIYVCVIICVWIIIYIHKREEVMHASESGKCKENNPTKNGPWNGTSSSNLFFPQSCRSLSSSTSLT